MHESLTPVGHAVGESIGAAAMPPGGVDCLEQGAKACQFQRTTFSPVEQQALSPTPYMLWCPFRRLRPCLTGQLVDRRRRALAHTQAAQPPPAALPQLAGAKQHAPG